MSINDLITQYQQKRQVLNAYYYAMGVIGWDSETEAPKLCFPNRSLHYGTLAGEAHQLATSPEFIAIVNSLNNRKDELDHIMKKEIKKIKKSIDQQTKIPKDEYIAYRTLLARSQSVWAEAKNKNDFKLFQPDLEKIVAFQHKIMDYFKTDDLSGYNVLLDRFEEEMKIEEYDLFFDTLKKDLVPFVKEKLEKTKDRHYPFLNQSFPIDKQKEFSNYLMRVLNFDLNRGLMKESEHPFTSGFGTTDIRWTNHFYENDLLSSIFSAIHELGHATYEQQCNPELDLTALGGGTSMVMHESQSRFYENVIGRSLSFWKRHYPKLKRLFSKQLKNISVEEFYQAVNHVESSLIRVEADELTYPLHIMLRYDIEKALMANQLAVKDLPKVWNEKVKEYLGIEVPSDTLGVLQDVHWSAGLFGYFPSYALGSAYAAQIYHTMQKELNIDKIIKTGTTVAINEWLKNKIHWHGGTKSAKEILSEVTGEPFNPNYYINYLKEKYSKI